MTNDQDPNSVLRRSLQEFVNTAAAPLTGQTRDLMFFCYDRSHFEKVAEHLRTELTAAGVFKAASEFKLVYHPGPNGCLMTGELVPTLKQEEWQGAEKQAELARRYGAAYDYVSRGGRSPA